MIPKIFLFFAVILAAAPAAWTAVPQEESSLVLLTPPEEISANPFYKKVFDHTSTDPEPVKIQYLIGRLRRSDCTFIRNNETFNGSRAADHISMKYRMIQSRIKTAKDFIENAAAKSLLTGEIYRVKIAGRIYPLREVLYNELAVFENNRKQNLEKLSAEKERNSP